MSRCNDPIGTDKEGNEITLIDILGTEADDVVDRVQLKIEKSKIYKNLDILDDREQEVIRGRFGQDWVGKRGHSRRLRRSWDFALVRVADRETGADEAVP